MSLDMPLSVQVEEWRKRAAAGDVSLDEMKQIIAALRQGRLTAAATSAKSRAAKAPVNTAALLDEIDNL